MTEKKMSELPDALVEKWDQADATGARIPVGDIVVCDVCNQDFTDSDATGGFLFGSYAYCPACAESSLKQIQSFNEEDHIRARTTSSLRCSTRIAAFIVLGIVTGTSLKVDK